MHMADALLSTSVGGAMCLASAGAIGYSVLQLKKEDVSEKKLPLMAVVGAFVFAAQMINFTIPGTGSSGHIGGGILLAGILGGPAALLTMAVILIVQSLFFADGGVLALGANIFNMGVIPCLVIYPLLFKPFLQKAMTSTRLTIISIISVVIGLQIGAFGVVLQTLASGITELPFATFALLMQPIHLAIGLMEGIVTASVFAFVYSVRPEIFANVLNGSSLGMNISLKKLVVAFAILTLVVGGGLSLMASEYPDGLEWSIEHIIGDTELEGNGTLHALSESIQGVTAFLPDYDFADGDGKGTSVAGIIGSILTFALAGAIGLLISLCKKKEKVTA